LLDWHSHFVAQLMLVQMQWFKQGNSVTGPKVPESIFGAVGPKIHPVWVLGL